MVMSRLRALLAIGVLAALVVLVLNACGGGAQENKKKSTSGGTADTNGQIVFRRWFDPDHTEGALLAMNPDGSHIRQITPSQGLARRQSGVVSRWAEGRLPSTENERVHEPDHCPQPPNRRYA